MSGTIRDRAEAAARILTTGYVVLEGSHAEAAIAGVISSHFSDLEGQAELVAALPNVKKAMCSYYCLYDQDAHAMEHGKECIAFRAALAKVTP